MRRSDTVRALAKVIKPYGLIVVEGDHRRIVTEDGQVVYHFSGSPSCSYFAENTLRDLIRIGLVPQDLKRRRLRG